MARQGEGEWSIARIMAGDGSTTKAGTTLRRGYLFASASMTGGPETFYEIAPNSLKLATPGGTDVCFSVQPVTSLAKQKPLPKMKPRTRIFKRDRWPTKQKKLRTAVKRFCLAHSGFAVIVGGPGARTVSTQSWTRIHVSTEETFMQADKGECLVAAVVNAVGILKGSLEAKEAERKLKSSSRHYRSIASCARDIQLFCSGYDLRKVPRSSLASFNRNKLEWVCNLNRGVWLVRLLRTDVIDHCIVVDGARRLVYDGAEKHAIRLSVDALIHCGGDKVEKLVIAEVRQIHPVVLRPKKRPSKI